MLSFYLQQKYLELEIVAYCGLNLHSTDSDDEYSFMCFFIGHSSVF